MMRELVFHRSFLPAVDRWATKVGFHDGDFHSTFAEHGDRVLRLAIVNALQHHATVVVQKSLAEGFGLTVAEAMWKSRPVVATAVGGILDQVTPGETGVLLDDALDLGQYGHAVCALLDDADERARLGANARQRAVQQFLGDRHLENWAQLFAGLEAPH